MTEDARFEAPEPPPGTGGGEPTDQPAAPLYFPVSMTKFLVLSLCTFGIYQFYWFHANWKIIKRREGSNISPFWRTFFVFVFCYALFDRIRKSAASLNIASGFHPGLLTAVWIGVSLAANLPAPYMLIGLFQVGALVPLQRAVIAINAKAAPGIDPNRRFGPFQIIVVVILGPNFLLTVAAILIAGGVIEVPMDVMTILL